MNAHTPRPYALPMVQPLAGILENFYSADAPRFRIGDSITFEKACGARGIVTILGFHVNGEVEAMFFNGRGHHVDVSIEDLSHLRIVRVETMRSDDVEMYRRLLGLEPLPTHGSAKFEGPGLYSFELHSGCQTFLVEWNEEYRWFFLSEPETGEMHYAVCADHFDRTVIGRLTEFEAA